MTLNGGPRPIKVYCNSEPGATGGSRIAANAAAAATADGILGHGTDWGLTGLGQIGNGFACAAAAIAAGDSGSAIAADEGGVGFIRARVAGAPDLAGCGYISSLSTISAGTAKTTDGAGRSACAAAATGKSDGGLGEAHITFVVESFDAVGCEAGAPQEFGFATVAAISAATAKRAAGSTGSAGAAGVESCCGYGDGCGTWSWEKSDAYEAVVHAAGTACAAATARVEEALVYLAVAANTADAAGAAAGYGFAGKRIKILRVSRVCDVCRSGSAGAGCSTGGAGIAESGIFPAMPGPPVPPSESARLTFGGASELFTLAFSVWPASPGAAVVLLTSMSWAPKAGSVLNPTATANAIDEIPLRGKSASNHFPFPSDVRMQNVSNRRAARPPGLHWSHRRSIVPKIEISLQEDKTWAGGLYCKFLWCQRINPCWPYVRKG